MGDLELSDYSVRTLRAYSFAALTWLRVLWALETPWERAVESDVAAMVGWLRRAANPQRRRAQGSATAGSVNVKTGKRRLPEGYSSSKINQTLAAIHGFYGFHARFGAGPLVNPVPVGGDRRRVLAHHNPLQPLPRYRRAPLRQQVVPRTPRAIPDVLWAELFDAMSCDRDRALASCFVSSGARSAELLGVTLEEVDWPGQRLWVTGKGGRRRMVPVSPEAMRWLLRYVAEDPPGAPRASLWRTRDGRQRPLTYWALRRVLQRANKQLETDWTWHDLRHTAAIRMVSSGSLSLPEVQSILGHADLRTTGEYLHPRVEEMVDKLAEFYQRPRPERRFAAGYSAEDLQAVFGG
ncbi:tyrosine-type recombinase/integrase [Micromonospora chalcea]